MVDFKFSSIYINFLKLGYLLKISFLSINAATNSQVFEVSSASHFREISAIKT